MFKIHSFGKPVAEDTFNSRPRRWMMLRSGFHLQPPPPWLVQWLFESLYNSFCNLEICRVDHQLQFEAPPKLPIILMQQQQRKLQPRGLNQERLPVAALSGMLFWNLHPGNTCIFGCCLRNLKPLIIFF